METYPIVILGTGPEARMALDIYNENEVLAYGMITIDPDKVGSEINDISVFGTLEDEEVLQVLKTSTVDYIVMEGDIPVRKDQYKAVRESIDRPAKNAIHRTSAISPYAKTGFGNLFSPSVAINANATVGDMNLFYSHVSVEPDAVIGNYCNIGSGVRIGGNAVIEDEVFIGTGAVIHPGVKVCQGAMIGAGSVVLKEVPAGKSVFGNPAQEV